MFSLCCRICFKVNDANFTFKWSFGPTFDRCKIYKDDDVSWINVVSKLQPFVSMLWVDVMWLKQCEIQCWWYIDLDMYDAVLHTSNFNFRRPQKNAQKKEGRKEDYRPWFDLLQNAGRSSPTPDSKTGQAIRSFALVLHFQKQLLWSSYPCLSHSTCTFFHPLLNFLRSKINSTQPNSAHSLLFTMKLNNPRLMKHVIKPRVFWGFLLHSVETKVELVLHCVFQFTKASIPSNQEFSKYWCHT